jgi:hypothetical protein
MPSFIAAELVVGALAGRGACAMAVACGVTTTRRLLDFGNRL